LPGLETGKGRHRRPDGRRSTRVASAGAQVEIRSSVFRKTIVLWLVAIRKTLGFLSPNLIHSGFLYERAQLDTALHTIGTAQANAGPPGVRNRELVPALEQVSGSLEEMSAVRRPTRASQHIGWRAVMSARLGYDRESSGCSRCGSRPSRSPSRAALPAIGLCSPTRAHWRCPPVSRALSYSP